MPRVEMMGEYRGVSLFSGQSEARLTVVRREIDRVLDEIEDPLLLAEMAGDGAFAPETRLLAEAKCKAVWRISTERGKPRPEIDLELLAAHTAGLDSTVWRSKTHYATGLGDDLSRAVPREVPLPDGEGV
jgi:hypothetical protein